MAPKLSKKEEKRLQALRLELEANATRRRQELQREIEMQKKRRNELDRRFQDMVLKIKVDDQRKDISIMYHMFERAYGEKEYYINKILRLIDDAQLQYDRTVYSFCDTIDCMINNFLSSLEEMQKENEINTLRILQMGEEASQIVMENHTIAETHLQLLLYHSDKSADAAAWSCRGANIVEKEEELARYSNIRVDLCSFLENAYNNMWDEYKAHLKAYIANTSENQKNGRILRAKDNIMSDIIAKQTKQIANSDSLLRKLRSELVSYESGTKQAKYRDRHRRYSTVFHRLRDNFLRDCNSDEKRLNILVNESDIAIKWIKSAHEKGEKVLRLASLCRKYETLKEKILPFGCRVPILPFTADNRFNTRRGLSSEDALILNTLSSTSSLKRLWRRVANADLGRRALIREKILLQEEHKELHLKIQEIKLAIPMNPEARNMCICLNSPPNQ